MKGFNFRRHQNLQLKINIVYIFMNKYIKVDNFREFLFYVGKNYG